MEISTLRTLLIVARVGSFAGAARALNVDPSSVSRLVAQAEAELNFRLFQRSTRKLALTEAGETYLARIAPLLDEFDAARDAAGAGQGAVTGWLRLTASVAFAHVCLVPHLADFRAVHPGLEIELLATDERLDLLEHSIDLAIRLTDAPAGALIGTRLMPTRYHVCAAPGYLATYGPVNRPQDLADHDCLRFALPDYRSRWMFREGTGMVIDVPVSGSVTIGSALSVRTAARDGLGPALLADWLVRDDLAGGQLIDLFPDYRVTATSYDTAAWALYPSRSYLPRKVRAAIDFFRPRLTAQ